MDVEGIISGIILISAAILLFLWWIYKLGENSVRTDLPRREQELELKRQQLKDDQASFFQNQSKESKILDERRKFLDKRERELSSQIEDISKREQNLTEKITFLENSRKEALHSIPWLAKAYADLDSQKAIYTAMRLETKNPPAFVAADKVREAGRARREAIYLAQHYKLQIDYYISLFPWLEDYLLLSSDEVSAMTSRSADDTTNNYNSYAAVKEWLSPDEYDSLPNSEKWQLALDRYNQRHKTNWQIGIDYERYIGYLCEQHGYTVRYNGATKGLEDMGRDLIAENGKRQFIIQCKRWSKEKTIHEKHIFQLYGTCVLYRLQNKGDCDVTGVFVTTTTLSDLARECAQYLKIKVYENIPSGEYPQIKCNISKDGEKIYHLPFDQQYDRTLVKPNTQDFYAFTVQEAERNGFRRAFRWHGN